jgi:hypothetical protein
MRHLLALVLCLLSAQVLAQCKAAPVESFQEFIAKFSDSKPLATSRTIYPTYTLRHEVGVENGKEVTSAVKTSVSKAKDETTPTIKQILAKNQMAMEIREVKSKQATVAVLKPDTDWLLTYHFINRQGCWYLHHIEDHSL